MLYAKKYSKNIPQYFDDLYQVGIIGLLHAIKNFDLKAKNNFYSYTAVCISGTIKNHFRNCTWDIKVSTKVKQHYTKYKKTEFDLTLKLERIPKVIEIAKEMNISIILAKDLMESTRHYQSLSWEIGLSTNNGEVESFDEIIGENDLEFENIERKEFFLQLERFLNISERDVIYKLFIEEWSQNTVAEYLNISQIQVSRLKKSALNKLKNKLNKEYFF